MPDSMITTKGRTTVPLEIREAVGLQTGIKLRWHLVNGGLMIVRAKTKSFKSLEGSLKVGIGKSIPIEAMNPWK
jgi:bifunctional DNA-binding transcriptional regulator/antitoxin component of YhaV-PrlF toxin-antitoxin module